MPWAAVGSVVAAGIGAAGANSAAKKAGKGADAAASEAARQYDQTRADQQPWMNAGREALPQLQSLAQKFGKMPTAADVMADPGYQFAQQQGTAALENSAAAGSGIFNGAVGKALMRYGQGNAAKFYNDAFNRQQTAEGNIWGRFAGLAGVGQSATNQVQNAGQQYSNTVGNIAMANGANQGNAAIAQSNAWGDALGQLGSMGQRGKFGNWGFGSTPGGAGGTWGGNTNPGAQIMPGQDYNYGGVESGWADGGPVDADELHSSVGAPGGDFERLPPKVREMYAAWGGGMGYADGGRVEPVIGSRTPLPVGSSGGGMSRENLMLQLMLQERMRAAAAASGVASGVPVSPLAGSGFDPRVINMRREQRLGLAHGGEVDGPGGPREDKIPAWLSDGEHVVDERAVTAAGRGSNAKGQQKFNRLRAMLHGGR